MRSKRSSRTVGVMGLVLFAGLLVGPAVSAQEADEDPLDGAVVDPEMIAALTEEIMEVASEGGTFDGDNLDELIGEPGKFDLPPGEIAVLAEGVIAADMPTDDSSSLVGDCMGIAISFEPDGSILDMASDFDDAAPPIDLLESDFLGGDPSLVQAFTADNPFEVHVDGTVVYAGVAGEPGAGPMDHTWSVSVMGLNLDSGGDPNPKGKNRNIGSVDLGEQLPAAAKVSALFRIEGEMTSANGLTCSGEGYFKTAGGLPILGGVGLVLALGFGLGGLFNARPARTFSG